MAKAWEELVIPISTDKEYNEMIAYKGLTCESPCRRRLKLKLLPVEHGTDNRVLDRWFREKYMHSWKSDSIRCDLIHDL
jgi:hypothetical protein